MLQVIFRNVDPDKVAVLRVWLKELESRSDEVRETFAQETVRHEIAFLLENADSPILVYAMEAEDFERARDAYQTSTLKIDHEHRAVMSEVLLPGAPNVERLYECAIDTRTRPGHRS